VTIDVADKPDCVSVGHTDDGDSSGAALACGTGTVSAISTVAPADRIRIALIDRHRFRRDCLISAFGDFQPGLTVIPFESVADCIRLPAIGLDIVLYYSHDDGPSEALALEDIRTLVQIVPDLPIVMLSDATSALQPANIRAVLNAGVRGIIPTLITDVPAAVAAIRFVRDGGTFAPLDVLLQSRKRQPPPDTPRATRLTCRQMTVLSHLREGKSNKVIAHDLGMTESTVKVHVRNIMRKMGAINRTQAVYKAQQVGDCFDDSELHD
jgi:DNA-binding NarL/FixJ family response regulator